jgi:hypothetical protein
MIARFRKYHRIITRCAHQVFCKSCGNLAMFTAIRRASSRVGHALNRKGAMSALGDRHVLHLSVFCRYRPLHGG